MLLLSPADRSSGNLMRFSRSPEITSCPVDRLAIDAPDGRKAPAGFFLRDEVSGASTIALVLRRLRDAMRRHCSFGAKVGEYASPLLQFLFARKASAAR
jgi:hypothetical protein